MKHLVIGLLAAVILIGASAILSCSTAEQLAKSEILVSQSIQYQKNEDLDGAIMNLRQAEKIWSKNSAVNHITMTHQEISEITQAFACVLIAPRAMEKEELLCMSEKLRNDLLEAQQMQTIRIQHVL